MDAHMYGMRSQWVKKDVNIPVCQGLESRHQNSNKLSVVVSAGQLDPETGVPPNLPPLDVPEPDMTTTMLPGCIAPLPGYLVLLHVASRQSGLSVWILGCIAPLPGLQVLLSFASRKSGLIAWRLGFIAPLPGFHILLPLAHRHSSCTACWLYCTTSKPYYAVSWIYCNVSRLYCKVFWVLLHDFQTLLHGLQACRLYYVASGLSGFIARILVSRAKIHKRTHDVVDYSNFYLSTWVSDATFYIFISEQFRREYIKLRLSLATNTRKSIVRTRSYPESLVNPGPAGTGRQPRRN